MTLVVVCELVWVLTQGYRYGRSQVALVLRKLLAARDLAVERRDLAWQALNLFEEGTADFSDYVIALGGRHEKATVTCTFDRRAARSPLFRLIEASRRSTAAARVSGFGTTRGRGPEPGRRRPAARSVRRPRDALARSAPWHPAATG